jgi:hypothetical protein
MPGHGLVYRPPRSRCQRGQDRALHGGAPVVTDGPFPEAKEFLIGFWFVDCDSEERAYAIAAKASRVGRRVRGPSRQRGGVMAARRTRPNGEGSIFPYRNGFAAYVWVDKPDGRRGRKWLYGKTREEVHDKWISLHSRAKAGPVPTKVPTVAEYIAYWLREVVRPNLAPGSYITYEALTRRHIVPGLGGERLDKLQVRDV